MNFNVDRLIEILEDNKGNHFTEYQEAYQTYTEKVVKDLEGKIVSLTSGKRTKLFVDLEEPKDHSKEYERVIKMLRMTTDINVHLDGKHFSQYVEDDWDWSFNFKNTIASYKGTF